MNKNQQEYQTPSYTGISEQFYHEVIAGLSTEFKQLPSKYFYDELGDSLFQNIMNCQDYYLTRCETEIFQEQTGQLADVIVKGGEFDLIELGAGDGTKTMLLINHLIGQRSNFRYMPIDISGNILAELEGSLRQKTPDLETICLEGEYLDMLREASILSGRRKVVLFLGSNVGNMVPADASQFFGRVRKLLQPGDLMLTGFDLKKAPELIRNAYADRDGITRAFNLNLLQRINRDLGADFNLELFEHYCNYDPQTGACNSYLVSKKDQVVHFPGTKIEFSDGECIWTEVSQKYHLTEIAELAKASDFIPVASFTDSRGWFADVIWQAD